MAPKKSESTNHPQTTLRLQAQLLKQLNSVVLQQRDTLSQLGSGTAPPVTMEWRVVPTSPDATCVYLGIRFAVSCFLCVCVVSAHLRANRCVFCLPTSSLGRFYLCESAVWVALFGYLNLFAGSVLSARTMCRLPQLG